MFYLAWQILFWLFLAFLLGLFFGWLTWGRLVARLRGKLVKCEDNLELYKKELEEAAPPLPGSIPIASPDEGDDLKDIFGVGPFLEKKLNNFGIYTFKQVATLKPDVIKELGATFGSFSDRIVRERWVEQARELHEKKYGERL